MFLFIMLCFKINLRPIFNLGLIYYIKRIKTGTKNAIGDLLNLKVQLIVGQLLLG